MTWFQISVKERMQEIVDEACLNNNQDPETYFDTVFEEVFNSDEIWWENWIESDEITILEMNELLENYEACVEEWGGFVGRLTVDKLIQLFGVRYGESLKEDYIQLLKDKINNQP